MLSELSKTDNEAKQALIRQDTTDMKPFYFDNKPFRYTPVKLFLNNSERRGQVDEKSIRNKSIKSSL